MACTQLRFEVPIIDGVSVVPDEPKTVNLLKTSAIHIINPDPCTLVLDICVSRVVKCQNGCMFERFVQDFPIHPCDPILPPGEYEISIPETQTAIEGSIVTTVDVIFEEVTEEYVQAIIANKTSGSC